MYYRLKKQFRLRGWEKLPWALVERPQNRVMFLNRKEFEAVSCCNGYMDTESVFVTPEQKEIMELLAQKGIAEPCELGDDLDPVQEYHFYPNRFIRTAHWSVTGRCNFRCKHCFMSAPEARLGELPHDTCMDIIDQMADCGVQHVSLTGGEPLVRKDFMEIVDRLLEKEIDITTIYSNGKLVTPELLDALEARGICPKFDMSFDGVGWHDWLRGIDGAEKMVTDAFQRCKERGFPTGSELCLHRGNKDTLRESVNRLAGLGVESLKVNPVSSTDLWENYDKDYSLSLDEVLDLYLEYIPHFFEDDMPINLMLGGLFVGRKGSTNYLIPAAKYPKGTDQCLNNAVCGHARNTLYLSPEGRMLPCMSLSSMDVQYQYPLITDIGLRKGLTDSVYMSLIDTRVSAFISHNAECQACEYKYICGAGCRASSMEYGDDIMGPDRAVCKILKEGYVQKVKEAVQKGMALRQ